MKKLLAMMLMLASVFFFACSDDDESSQLSPEEAKTELNNLNTDMSGYLEEMVNSDGLEVLDILMGMPDPFVDVKSTSRTSVIPNIKKFLLPVNPEKTKSTFEVSEFDFAGNVGTYTWNAIYAKWDVIHGTPDNKIIIRFPTEGSTSNNATVTIHNYDEVLITEYDDYWQEYDYYYNPTDILADIYVNTVKIVEIDLEATWITSGDAAGEPTSLDISVYLTPFSFTGNFDHTSTTASINFAINYNNESIFSAGVNATFQNDDMEDPITVGGYVQLLNVKVQAEVDVQGIDAIFTALEAGTSNLTTMEELTDAINNEIDAVVLVDGVKAADIEILFDENAEEVITIVFVFSDGTTEPAEQYFTDFVTDIEDFFFFLDDIYSDW